MVRSAPSGMGISTAMFAATFAAMLCAEAAAQTVMYAAPDGSGTAGTLAAPCSLTGARDVVRTINAGMADDIVVYLRGGWYMLGATLTFD
jgi:hypothetical protein